MNNLLKAPDVQAPSRAFLDRSLEFLKCKLTVRATLLDEIERCIEILGKIKESFIMRWHHQFSLD